MGRAVSRRVLVVDDYEDTVTILCAALNAQGHTSVGVYTGREAIVMTQVFMPHVVLLDLGLPDMMGLDVAHTLRELDPRMLIIVITGWTSPAIREQAFAAHDIDLFECKPASLDDLMPLIRYGHRP